MECYLVGRCLTDPGLVIWMGPGSEIPNGSEFGEPNGVHVGNFWSDPGLVIWWDVWLEAPMDLSSAMGDLEESGSE